MVSQRTLRVKFEKTGKLKFISHLDLMRTLHNALRRADLPVEYSEGFNPHMKISFALPLSIGTESTSEFLDIHFRTYVRENEVKDKLDHALPDEISIKEVYEPDSKLTDIKYASYTLYVDFGNDSEKAEKVAKELFKGSVFVNKRTKSGDKDVDIMPMIKNIECRFSFGILVIDTVLCADSANYLNPTYIINALGEKLGKEPDNVKIMRTGAFFSDGKIFR